MSRVGDAKVPRAGYDGRMSRLDSFIRRLEAQRVCLAFVREALTGVPGCIFELGLGNGRTYDHLRELFPNREIFAFEQRLVAHPSCIPEEKHLFMGDFLDVLPTLLPRFAGRVALVHADCGSGQPKHDAIVSSRLGALLSPFLAPDGMVLSDSALGIPATDAVVNTSIPEGRYFIARKCEPSGP